MKLPGEDEYLTHIAYDSVVFGFSGSSLNILIMEYHNTGYLALPGGFVRRHENLNDAVRRGLYERTGLKDIYLEQFYTFGSIQRYQSEIMENILKANGLQIPEKHWMLERFISVAYYALINHEKVVLQPDILSDAIKWVPLDDIPPLILDHNRIIEKALEALRENVEKKLIGVNLLAHKFTMKELQKVSEAILGRPLHRGAFQRKVLSQGILRRHDKLYSGKAHKAPYLYSFIEIESEK